MEESRFIYFLSLPTDLINYCIEIVGVPDLLNLSQTCKLLFNLIRPKFYLIPALKATSQEEFDSSFTKIVQNHKVDGFNFGGSFEMANPYLAIDHIKMLSEDIYSLDFSYCSHVGDSEVKCLSNSKVQHLTLCSCPITDDAIAFLPKNLKFLELSFCRISDSSMKYLPSGLEVLVLFACSEIGDEAIASLPANLRELNLYGCERLTSKGLMQLPRKLEVLDISFSIEVNDSVIPFLPDTLLNLSLAYCKSLSDNGMQYLPSKIKYLSISGNANYTNKALEALSRLPLEFLHLSGCTGITDEGLLLLPKTMVSVFLRKEFKISPETEAKLSFSVYSH